MAQSIDLSDIRRRCQKHDVRGIYQALATTGMNVGPTFENIVQLFVGQGEALGEVRLPDHWPREIGAYTFLHFSRLDACLQVVQTLVPREFAHLPLGIDEIQVCQPGRAFTSLWSHVQYRSGQRETGSHRVDIQLLDENGGIVALLLGVRFQRASRKSVRGSSRQQDWFYQINWQPSPLAQISPYAEKAGHWLIVADAREAAAALIDQLDRRGESSELLLHSADESYWDIDTTRLYRGVIYLCPLNSDEMPKRNENANIPNLAERFCADVLHIVQAFAKAPNPPRLWIVTREAIADGRSRPIQVQQTPLWGLGRTIAWEHPELQCTCIDLANDTPAESLFASVWFSDRENEMILRSEERLVARLGQQRGATQSMTSPFAIDPKGTYLITGGLGGLGLEVAKWLVSCGARHLVLSGRSGAKTPAAQKTLAALATAGANVRVEQADIAQMADVERLITTCEAYAPLRGIVHAAGVLDDGILLQQNRIRLASVMAPKVAGSWNLHRATQKVPLDFFIFFSSMASLFGMPGQGNYAAANAFMDGLAAYRRVCGLPAFSINWAGWADVGMAAEAVRTSRFMEGIVPEEGVQLLGALIPREPTQIAVLPLSWPEFEKEFPLSTTIPLFDRVLQANEITKKANQHSLGKSTANEIREQLAGATNQFDLLVAHIQDEIVGVLGKPIGPDDLFLEVGIDSLMSIQLSNRLAAKLGLALPATLLFDFATLAQLTDQLLRLIGTQQNGLSPLTKATRKDEWFPLSAVQQQFILPETAVAHALVNVCSLYSLRGMLDVAALQRVGQALIDRHDALRLMVAQKDGAWMQRVRTDAHLFVEIIDAPEWSRAELTEQVGIVWQKPFDLTKDLPVRAYLFRHASDQHTFALVYHHIVTDGSSHQVVSRELPRLYDAEINGIPADLPALPWSYVDHLQWESAMLQGPEGERLWQYWREQLPNPLPVLELPTDRPFPPAMTHRGRDYIFQLAPNLAHLQSVCRSQNVTPYTVLLAAFQVLLHGYSGQCDILVGSEVQNRIRAEQSGLVGSLADHSISYSILDRETMFPAYLQKVRKTVRDIFAHQGYPLLALAERLGAKPAPGSVWVRQPLIQVVLNYLGSWGDEEPEPASNADVNLQRNGLQWQHLEIDWPHLGSWEDYFTLVIAEIPGDGLMGFAAYNTDVFDEPTMARMMTDYRTLLAAIVENPAQSIDALLATIGKTAPVKKLN